MQDLFTQTKSKKEQLLDWMLENLYSKNWVRTSDVLGWGIKNFHNRALRDVQQMCAEGKFRRVTKDEHDRFFCGSKQEAWVRNDFV